MRTRRNGGAGRTVTRSWWALALCGIALLCAPLLAHHSFAVFYLEADTIEVDGDIVEFQYKNPHSWVHIVGQETFGKPMQYAAEWTSTSQLERSGITKTTLRAGDTVRIWASPNKNPNDNRIRLKRIERPSDGWKWQGGRESR
jgi:Family of unknown function (DUF6152)